MLRSPAGFPEGRAWGIILTRDRHRLIPAVDILCPALAGPCGGSPVCGMDAETDEEGKESREGKVEMDGADGRLMDDM